MNKKSSILCVLERDEMEACNLVVKDGALDALKDNAYSAYYVVTGNDRDVLLFADQELEDVEENIETLLLSTVYSDDYDWSDIEYAQIFINTETIKTKE